ncbi:MAG: DUF5752 family protein [Nitrospirae bacterium]|nr:DUF5752 family protein [Nitrospirota bacterium]MCL5237708.1 DUF5752 family protein [Nitrospirota bacterium]
MEKSVWPFDFKQCITILKATGEKAKNLRELRDVISIVSGESIFHHVYQYFLKGHILEYTNDFAQWTGESLEESALSEHLSNTDPYAFENIHELRGRLVDVIDEYLKKTPGPKEVLPGNEFHFNQTITLIFPAEIRVRNLAEFLIAIKYVDGSSLYYHFYEARTRLGGGRDDFSQWFEDALGKGELAERIRAIDLFMHTTEGIRRHIADTVEEEVRRDMYGTTHNATVFWQ